MATQKIVAKGLTDLRITIRFGGKTPQVGGAINVSPVILRGWKNIYTGGKGTIQGIVTIENIPGSRQVRLFDKQTGALVGETWSASTGHYEFNNILEGKEYFVVAHDHFRVYNGVIQDMLKP